MHFVHMHHAPARFADRAEAGRALAARLGHLRGQNVIVLALPRGGVPVGFEVARALDAPLDVLNVRKLGVPWHEELAMGAIATGGVRVLNEPVIRAAHVSGMEIRAVEAAERRELERREQLYRGGRPAPALGGRTVVLVDDGIATGSTARAAIAAIRAQQPARVVLAVPVAEESVVTEFAGEVDEMVCVLTPERLYAIGLWYDDFRATSDEVVRATLARAATAHAPTAHAPTAPPPPAPSAPLDTPPVPR